MRPVVVYGGGVPALATAVALLDAGLAVDLVGPTDAAREPHLPEGGMATAHDADAFARHVAGGAEPTTTHRALAESASQIVEQLASWGVPFARDGGELALRRLPGWPEADAVFVGSGTAQVVAWAFDLQLARSAENGELRRLPERELLELVRDDAGAVVGAVFHDRIRGSVETLAASAVVLASGNPPGSTAGGSARTFPEAAIAAAYRAGAHLRGTGRPRRHPTLLAHGRHPQPLSSALRSEGARFWVPLDDKEVRIPRDIPSSDRDYFVREELGEDGRLANDATLAELVRRVTRERGIYDRVERANKETAYLDISHLPAGHLASRVGDELRAIAARAPRDPSEGPFEVSSGAVSLGVALDVEGDGEIEGRTTLAGLWAVGTPAWRDVADRDGVALITAIHHGRRVAAAIATMVNGNGDHEDALSRAQRDVEDALCETEEVVDEAVELAELLDALAFDEDEASNIGARLEELLAPTRREGQATDPRHRGLVAGLELGLAACKLRDRSTPSTVRRNEDGLPEEA